MALARRFAPLLKWRARVNSFPKADQLGVPLAFNPFAGGKLFVESDARMILLLELWKVGWATADTLFQRTRRIMEHSRYNVPELETVRGVKVCLDRVHVNGWISAFLPERPHDGTEDDPAPEPSSGPVKWDGILDPAMPDALGADAPASGVSRDRVYELTSPFIEMVEDEMTAAGFLHLREYDPTCPPTVAQVASINEHLLALRTSRNRCWALERIRGLRQTDPMQANVQLKIFYYEISSHFQNYVASNTGGVHRARLDQLWTYMANPEAYERLDIKQQRVQKRVINLMPDIVGTSPAELATIRVPFEQARIGFRPRPSQLAPPDVTTADEAVAATPTVSAAGLDALVDDETPPP